MKLRNIILSIIVVLSSQAMKAQRIVGELETNTDQNGMMMPSDTTGMSSEDGDKKKKIVPTSVYAWTVDETFGNRHEATVDTMSHLFYNSNLPEGIYGHYNALGNLGAPRLSRVFMDRQPAEDFIFLSPLDQFNINAANFKFYNTKSPYMNVSYHNCGSKQTGYDRVRAIFTTNIGKRINFGAMFDYMYGQGYYLNQSTSLMNGSVWASYLGDKYVLHSFYQHNAIKMGENGGITDEAYITDPTSITTQNTSSDNIPTRLDNSWNIQSNDVLYLNHHYSLGFYEEDYSDSLKVKKEFVPVTKFFHTFKFGKYSREYRSYNKKNNFYTYDFMPSDTTSDKVKELTVKNILGVALCEGFNKWAAFGINLYAGHELRQYQMVDAIDKINGTTQYGIVKHSENDFFVGGQIIRQKGKLFHFNADAKFVFAGKRIADLDINGHAEFNFRFLKDTAQVAVNGYIKNLAPDFFMQHYHSRHTWYDEDLSKEWRTRIEGVLQSKRTKTKVIVGFENIKNLTYLQDNGEVKSDKEFTQNASLRQESGMVQVLTAQLQQNFKLSIIHLDNEVTLQFSSNQNVLPLPLLNLYHNLYLKFVIAKVLKTEIGADMKFFTSYDAPTYSPSTGMFMNQNEGNRIKIGNRPIISPYVNLDLKKFRFYIQYYNATGYSGRPFWAPYYAISPAGLHFGVSWNFYD